MEVSFLLSPRSSNMETFASIAFFVKILLWIAGGFVVVILALLAFGGSLLSDALKKFEDEEPDVIKIP